MVLNKKITLHDGHKVRIMVPTKPKSFFINLFYIQLILIVKFSPAPNMPMNDELKEKIKHVMARRYDPATLALDLSQFHLDEGNY